MAPSRLYGGWPHFDITGFSRIGYAGSENSPYVDDNWQYQYSANASWTQGIAQPPLRRRHRPAGVESPRDRFAVPAAFTFGGGPTTILGGPSANTFNNFATFLLGLPTQIAKSVIPFEDNQTRSRNWQFSLFAKDQWQIGRALTASLGVRWDYFPMGTRTTSGLERFDYVNNQMLICGVGPTSRPTAATTWARATSRRASAWPTGRATRWSFAAATASTTIPYPLAFVRDLLGNYPSSIGLTHHLAECLSVRRPAR